MKRMRIMLRGERHKLPDSDFAYVDPKTGHRLLPIIDKPHTRAAIIAVISWKGNDPAKRIAMKNIEKRAKKFGITIAPKHWKIPEEPWSVS